MSDHPVRGHRTPAPSAADLEREILQTRQSLEGTFAQIERDLAPRQWALALWSGVARGAEGLASSVAQGAATAQRHVRRHPAAYALLATGLFAVALSAGRDRARARRAGSRPGSRSSAPPLPPRAPAEAAPPPAARPREQGEGAGSAREGPVGPPRPNGENGESARRRGPFLRLQARAEVLREHAALRARAFAQEVAEGAARTRARVRIRLEEQPFGWAILGLCAGALAAALLPQQERERRILRPAREGLLAGSTALLGAWVPEDPAAGTQDRARAKSAGRDIVSAGSDTLHSDTLNSDTLHSDTLHSDTVNRDTGNRDTGNRDTGNRDRLVRDTE